MNSTLKIDKTDKSPLMRPKEAAELADCSTRTITRMCEAGLLDSCKFGRTWRLNRASFLRRIGEAK